MATRAKSSATGSTKSTHHAAAAVAAAAGAGDDGRHAAFELNPQQYDFVFDDQHKYCAYIGGLGAGKSFAGAVKALRYMVEHPGSLGMIGAPTYPMLRDSTLRTVTEVFPRGSISYTNKTDGIIRLHNGSEALLRSMDNPDARRGPNLSWFWLDEAPLCGYYSWKVMKGRIRVKEHPARAWATGTPHGQDEFYEDFEQHPDASHALYRASTRDNAHNLAEHYIEDMGYTGQFALQEIEGLFVKFEGLVYDFHSEWHLGEWAATGPDRLPVRPRLRIGGVDWGRTNPAVALPIYVTTGASGDDRVWLLDEFYQRGVGFMGDAPVVGEGGLSRAILDFTRDYGIETWYCGPDEPEHIAALNALFGRHGVRARAVAAADDIMPGIETVTGCLALRTDGTAGFQMSARCAQTKAELRTYSYPKASEGDKRDPADRPIKKFDHACFVAGTLIETASGPRPIEQIARGEFVLTRDGLLPVFSAGLTNLAADVLSVECSNGARLTGTGNHPVWVVGKGWTRLDALHHGDRLLPCTRKPSSSMTPSFAGIQSPSAGLTACITRLAARIASMALVDSTRRSGRRTTARFLPAAISTIATAIHSTTRWTISSAWTSPRTIVSTAAGQFRSEDERTSIASGHWQRTGTAHLRGAHGIARMHRGRSFLSGLRASAHSVASHSLIAAHALIGDSAPRPARRPGDGALAWTMKHASVAGAATSSPPTATPTADSAAVRVLRVRSMPERAPVYNLSVAWAPEYYANGVLVHNCDGLRYALHTALGGKTRHRGFTMEQAQQLNPRKAVSSIGGIKILKKTF